MEINNRIDGSNEEGNFTVVPSGENTNMTEYDISVLFWVDTTIDDGNDLTPYNVPEHKAKQQGNEQQEKCVEIRGNHIPLQGKQCS